MGLNLLFFFNKIILNDKMHTTHTYQMKVELDFLRLGSPMCQGLVFRWATPKDWITSWLSLWSPSRVPNCTLPSHHYGHGHLL
jgi:hypothetical protein